MPIINLNGDDTELRITLFGHDIDNLKKHITENEVSMLNKQAPKNNDDQSRSIDLTQDQFISLYSSIENNIFTKAKKINMIDVSLDSNKSREKLQQLSTEYLKNKLSNGSTAKTRTEAEMILEDFLDIDRLLRFVVDRIKTIKDMNNTPTKSPSAQTDSHKLTFMIKALFSSVLQHAYSKNKNKSGHIVHH